MRHIAVDLGAESGRVVLGTFSDGRIVLEEMHRFPTPVATVDGTLRWDLAAIQAGIATGMRKAAASGPVTSMGVDTWGVDYGVLDAAGTLLTAPFCYRDPRTDGLPAAFAARFGAHGFFARSGVRPLVFNTVFQLAAHGRSDPALFARAAAVIPISDVLHQWLSGVLAWERTQVGTWGLATPGATAWDTAMIRDLGLDPRLFGPITATGSTLGPVRPELATAWGLNADCRVVVPGGHDTASAVAGMIGDPATTAYLSSGTWSLLGCIADAPNTSEAFFDADFSNEIAVDGRVRLNCNIMGLWIIQECRRAFVAAGRTASYADLAAAAALRPGSLQPLAVDDPRFFAPAAVSGPMPARIAAWCREQQVPVPADDVGFIRLVTDGLAAAYARALTDLERLAGRRFAAINVVGGGAHNRLLNQCTADACGRPVMAGPTEATALGNLVVQAQGCGQAIDRSWLVRSTTMTVYEPGKMTVPAQR